MDWIVDNWQWFLIGFVVAEKVVKITPTKYDDILLDVLWDGLKKVVGKKR